TVFENQGMSANSQSGRRSFVYATIAFPEPSNGDEMAQSAVALPSDHAAGCDIAQARDRTNVYRREKSCSGLQNRANTLPARAKAEAGPDTARLIRGAYRP